MPRRQRSDANQAAIVDRYRRHGCSVLVLSQWCSVDLLVACRGGSDRLIEIKDPKKPKSARGLTPAEVEFHASWRGRPVLVVEDFDDVDEHVAEMQAAALVDACPIPRVHLERL
jgi:hypothetical protein